jgi:uncharacterized membrane protein HdeD (DUF308 family)
MARSREEKAPLSTGFLIGAWVQLGLGVALVLWGLVRWAPLAALIGVFALLRGIISVQRYRTEKEKPVRTRLAEAEKEFR